jgi:formylglycine-generating enzyme required for sulfatase activity
MPQAFDPYHKWLGIPKDEQPPNHYRLLAIGFFEDDGDVIQAAADRQMAHLRTYQNGPNSELSQKLLNEVAAARVCLLKPATKKAYDARLRKELEAKAAPAQPTPATKGAGLDLGELLEELTVASEAQPPLRRSRWASNLPVIVGFVIAGIALLVALSIWRSVERRIPAEDPRPGTTAPGDAEKSRLPNPRESGQDATPPATNPHRPALPLQPPPGDAPQSAQEAAASPTPLANKNAPPAGARAPSEGKSTAPSVTPPSAELAVPPPSKRWPVPSASRQEELVRQVEKDYRVGQAGKLAEKVKLANSLLDAANKSLESDTRFVMRRKAADLALSAGNAALMLQAVERIGAEFDIDLLAAKETLLTSFAAEAESAVRIESLVDNANPVIDQLLAEERYQHAWDLMNVVYVVCQKPDGKAFRKSYHERRQSLQKTLEQWTRIRQALETIKTQPDDRQAQGTVGRWYCFVRRDWRKGLPYLAKGDDPVMAGPAKEELEAPADEAIDQVRLADAWWDVAGQANEAAKEAILLHARYWYQQAESQLPVGLVKSRAVKRLEEIAVMVSTVPGTPGLQPVLASVPMGAEAARDYQIRWARHLGLPDVETNSIGMELVLIPPGEFDIGSHAVDVDRYCQEAQQKGVSQGCLDFLRSETPRHPVRIARAFYLGMHEITQGQYQKVMRVNPSRSGASSDSSPVESVSWDEAMDFCRLLSELPEEKDAGRTYRLPSEAEWEYACRAGSPTGYHFGQEPASLDSYGWFAKDAPDSPHPVGTKQPNPWGLFDLYGNVGEWCRDWFAEDYYRQSPLEDPVGPISGKGHVVRGGSFREAWPGALRSAFRAAYPTGARHDTLGFRVVCTPSKKRSP